jgi:DNA transformation protein
MKTSADFIEFVVDQLSSWRNVTARRMFGGAGLYCDDIMFGLVAGDTAYLKVDDTNREQFVLAGSRPFKPYRNKATTMSYYEIPPDVLENRSTLGAWAELSLRIQKAKK